jgi:hypothetical protein
MRRIGKRWSTIATTVWLGAVGTGMLWLFRYSNTPGAAAVAPVSWPAEWKIRPAASGVTLVVALHPKCTCSRATLGELAEIMTRRQDGLHADVLMVGETSDRPHGELWDTAAAIPGVSVFADPDGAMANRLDAQTSGQTYAFDSAGHLQFSGGITPARGHMGDNIGAEALNALAIKQQPAQVNSPVFGCALTQRAQ